MLKLILNREEHDKTLDFFSKIGTLHFMWHDIP